MPPTATSFAERVAQVEQLAAAQPDQALALARLALAEPDEDHDGDPDRSDALNRLGMFFFHQAFAEPALAAYRRALARVEQRAPGDAVSQANLHNNIGQALGTLGRFADAVPHLERALALNRQAGSPAMQIAVNQDNLGIVLTGAGRVAEAISLHVQALDTFEQLRGPLNADAATALGNLAVACTKQGDRQRALACQLRSLDMHLAVAGPKSPGALVSAANLVDAALERNDLPLAGELCDVLLALAQDAGAGHAAAIALLQVAGHAFDAFSLGLADRLCSAALELLARSDDAANLDKALRLAGQVALAKGNTTQAEQVQLRLLATPGRSARDQARDWVEHGKNLRERGVQGARRSIGHFERALALLQSTRDATPSETAHVLGNLAEAQFRADLLDAADASFGRALAALGRTGHDEDRAWLRHAHGLLHFRRGRHADALVCLGHAQHLWTRLRGAWHPFVATACANLSLVHWDAGEHAAAARLLARAERLRAPELARQLAVGSDNERLETARSRIGDLYRAVSFHFATGLAEPLATRLVLQFKGAVQLATMRSQARLREQLAPAARTQLDRLAELQRQITALIAAEQLHDGAGIDLLALSPLQREAAELQRALGHRSARGQSALAAIEPAEVRAALPAGALLVEYLRWAVYEPRTQQPVGFSYAALLLRCRGAPHWVHLGAAAAIDDAVQAFRQALHDNAPLADVEHRLAHLILTPIATALAGAKQVIVAPDGALNLLPFASLLEPLLAPDALVHQVACGAELIDDDIAPAVGAAVAIVDPDYGSSAWEALPGTREEGALLRRLWPATAVHAGAEARADTLRGLQQPALLHIATHGHFIAPAGDRPLVQQTSFVTDEGIFIVQSPSRSARDDAMWHGGLALAGGVVVSAAELAQLDLRGTALVVLSACDTGVGSTGLGAEFAGLRRAFAIAGARSQLTSLWAVEDEATALLMNEFYAALRAGRPRAAALRDAQRALRARPSWSHPFHWAAFVLWGDAGPLPGHLLQEGA